MTRFRTIMTMVLAALLVAAPVVAQNFPGASGNPSMISRPGGGFYAPAFNWQGSLIAGNSATGSQTVTVAGNFKTSDGTSISADIIASTLTPMIFDFGQGNQETVTPTALSATTCPSGNLGIGSNSAQCLNFTGSFSNTHGQSAIVMDGTFGAQTAANFAQRMGGGAVTVDPAWAQMGGTNAILTAMTPYSLVSINDCRFGTCQPWISTQTTATVLAAPATLVNATAGFGVAGATSTGGSYTGNSTYIACIAYVDINGNEGPCSATFTIATSGTAATNQIGFTAPAASTGAVGYTIYIDLAGGTYNLTYQVPLTSTVCGLTKLETVTPACAVTNTNYAQTGSAAIVSALTVNTAPLHLLATTASTTAAYIGSPSGRTTYAYAPHNTAGQFGFTTSQQAYAIAPAAGSTVPEVIATIPVPIGFMNQVGRTIRICGQATEAANGSTATVQNIEFLWDAAGSNTTGAGVIVGQLQLTATLVTGNADHWSFCETLQTTVSGAGVTAGSIQPVGGQIVSTYGAGVLGNAGVDVNVSAVGSLNLAGTGGNTQRIHVVWVHTTGTDANGVTLNGLTVEVL